jgi:hypothetical protein
MVNTTRSLLQRKKIKIIKNVVCAGDRKGLKNEEKSASVIRLFSEQMKRLQQKTKVPRDIFGKAQSKITGKIGSHQDDLAIAALLGIHWASAHQYSKALPIMK